MFDVYEGQILVDDEEGGELEWVVAKVNSRRLDLVRETLDSVKRMNISRIALLERFRPLEEQS